MVRSAMAFALYKKGHITYLGRLLDFADSDKLTPQIQGYFVELGPSVIPLAVVRLRESDVATRRNLVTMLGGIGDLTTVTALTPYKEDPNRDVAAAATTAIERIKLTSR